MQKAKLMLTGLTFLGIAALAGCSFPGVYKIDIQQGNVVTQDMIDQLRPGMTQRQVRFIMGNPMITDTFHPNRWDYVYSMQPGGGKRQQERVSLTFDAQQRLTGLSGDFMPGTSRDDSILGSTAPASAPIVESAPAAAEPLPVIEQPSEPVETEVEAEPARKGSLLDTLQRLLDSEEPEDVPQARSIDDEE